jgi:hypothetical protein
MAKVKPDEVRAARAFLRKRGIGSSEVPPRKFAISAREMKKSFSDLLAFIGRLYQGRTDEASTRKEVILRASKSS